MLLCSGLLVLLSLEQVARSGRFSTTVMAIVVIAIGAFTLTGFLPAVAGVAVLREIKADESLK